MKKIYNNNNNNNNKPNIKRNYCSDVNLTRNFEILKIDAKKNYILQDWYSRLQRPRTSFVQLKTVATSSIQLSTHYTTLLQPTSTHYTDIAMPSYCKQLAYENYRSHL